MKILWFRRDLRVSDNPLLLEGGEVLPIFIFDRDILVDFKRDDRRFSFIFDALLGLKEELKKLGLDLLIFYAKPKEVFEFLKKRGAKEVVASVDFDSYAIKRDGEIERILPFTRIYDSFLFKPRDVLNKEGKPYKVFTPYYRKALEVLRSGDFFCSRIVEAQTKGRIRPRRDDYKRSPLSLDLNFDRLIKIKDGVLESVELKLEAINLKRVSYDLPSKDEIFRELPKKLPVYSKQRDFLNSDATTKVGTHLRFGTIGIRELLREALKIEDSEVYIKELLWREFYAQLLANFPHSEFRNFNSLSIEYKNSEEKFEMFKEAKTGVPIIDAGIVELKTTGYMHNRVRMIVASFLTKNLGVSWQKGEQFFKEWLFDYEASSNIGSWQWSAGSGADAQPYFRIFNPYLQMQKFDKECLYVKRWLPQLKSVEPKKLMSEKWLLENSIPSYPKPIVDIKTSKEEALKRVSRRDLTDN